MARGRGGYDDGYRACPCFWGYGPGSFVKWLVEELNHHATRVLDLGCGEGKNAEFFTSLGADVDAVDCSHLALENGRKAWPNAAVEWHCEDALTFLRASRDLYDTVVMYGLLHCLPSVNEIEETIESAKRVTAPAGYHVVCSFNDRYQDLSGHPDFAPLLVPHSLYVGMYRDWNVIRATDANLVETHPNNGIDHTHSMTRLIAQKPRD